MNQSSFQDWLGRNSRIPGLIGLAVSAPDKSSLLQVCTPNFLPEALDRAWRAVLETISVLQLNRFPTARFRFVYGIAIVHCERRRDGSCLGIFSKKSASEFSPAELDRLVAEFHTV
jgi:hypothetical protein